MLRDPGGEGAVAAAEDGDEPKHLHGHAGRSLRMAVGVARGATDRVGRDAALPCEVGSYRHGRRLRGGAESTDYGRSHAGLKRVGVQAMPLKTP